MIKCIAIDLDDTLLKPDLTISEANKEAISIAMSKGVKVLLASGRMYQSMLTYSNELGMNLPLVAYNGALIKESVTEEVLYHQPVNNLLALEIVTIFREAGIHLNVYLDDQLYMDQLTKWGQTYAKFAGVTPNPVGDVSRLLKANSPHKMLGFAEVEQIDCIMKKLEKKFGNDLDFVKSKPYFVEILAKGVSKGLALKNLTEKWQIRAEEVMAIGNAPNDLEMIEWAGVGVAVGNADDIVKAKADLVVADHNADGVAEAILMYIK
ncbi:MAG TPA: Cof-type HAD-IIB family hydrolase [Bacillota bacterium]|jgi:Cof subfamily protein (haloacid dehalogenase superfamily)|nr:Cof-type HAD-IIB family hydrolase [Bacillota bacterium]HOL09073.1 Cof-type HAD-IIB family hydrolase [Bacillota bacterium]HPO96748.1 Cof-type HAD-IIB family hydrolase [Bacillota bacterium]